MSTATTNIDHKPSLQASHCEDEGRSKRKQMHPLVPALRFNEFEGDFELSMLGNELNLFNGYAFSSTDSSDKGVRWVKIADVGINKMKLDAPSFLPFEFAAKHNKFILHKGDYVVALTRPILSGKLKIAKVNEDFDGSLLNQRVGKLESKNDLEYMYCMLQQKSLISRIENRIAGTDPPNLSPNEIATLKTFIPSLPEQQKIASFLSAVDEKIQQLTKKKSLLEDYKKGVMQQLFSGQLRFKPARPAGGDEIGNPYPDWEEKRLGEVFGVIRGKGISKDQLNDNGETKCILYGQLYTTYNEVVFNVVSRTDTNEGVLSIKGDLLVPSSTTTTGIDLANVTALNEEGVLLGGDISILRSKLDANNVFYAYYLSNHKKYEIAAFAQGSTIVHLSYNHFKVMRIDIPVIEEQQKIATYLSRIDTKIEAVNNQITQTQTFKKGLLQQMFV
jgi:type I restriction enzyme S subunit